MCMDLLLARQVDNYDTTITELLDQQYHGNEPAISNVNRQL